MGLYNVIEACIVEIEGEAKHFTHPHPAPVEVDDAAAAPLVETGQLTPVETPAAEPAVGPSLDAATGAEPDSEASEASRPLQRRRDEG